MQFFCEKRCRYCCEGVLSPVAIVASIVARELECPLLHRHDALAGRQPAGLRLTHGRCHLELVPHPRQFVCCWWPRVFADRDGYLCEEESRVVFLQLLVCVFSPGLMPRHVHPLAVCSGSSLRRHVHPSPMPGGLARQWSEISQSVQERATQVQRDHRDSEELRY